MIVASLRCDRERGGAGGPRCLRRPSAGAADDGVPVAVQWAAAAAGAAAGLRRAVVPLNALLCCCEFSGGVQGALARGRQSLLKHSQMGQVDQKCARLPTIFRVVFLLIP